MVSRTSNNKLPLPNKGSFEGTWGTDVMNEDMTDKLETKVPVRDIESNLSNYTPHNGAKFEATDTEAVFYGDGTSWIQADTLGQDPWFDTVTASSGINSNGGLDISGGDLSIGSLTDALVDLDSSSADSDEHSFYAEFVDNAGTSPASTIRWLRDAGNGRAFRVRDVTGGVSLLTVEDSGVIRFHENDVWNADVIYSGGGTNGAVDFTRRRIDTGGGDWKVRDTTNSSDIIRFKESNGVEVVSGGLDVNAGGLVVNTYTSLGGDLSVSTNDINDVNDMRLTGSPSFVMSSAQETGRIAFWNDYLGEYFMSLDNSNTRVNFPQGLYSDGNPVPYSSSGTEYDIQKNGSDGVGIINFKT